jgi:hypothetical protein
LNDQNCDKLIQEYCKSELDDDKTDVLLENFENVIKLRINEMEKSKNPSKKPSLQITQLEDELAKI